MILLLVLTGCSFLRGQDDASQTLEGFYPTADSISEFPDASHELAVICQKKIEGRYVTFIGRKNENKIFMAAVTLKPIKDVNNEISRIVNFDGPRPNPGKITTWGYVFDRNNDGKIDYMALVGGAGAFEDRKMPPDYPRRGDRLSNAEMQYFIAHCKLIFNHWADDNFDGTLDAGVMAEGDSVRDFVQRRIVVRSTRFNKKFDDVWGFQGSLTPTTEHLIVKYSPTRVPYFSAGRGKSEITAATFEEKTAILQLLNRAAAACRATEKISKPEN